jgi:hypothetical protein
MHGTVFQYMAIISPGPFILVRVPMTGKPRRMKHVIPWKTLLQGLTPVMHSHGMRAKDISMIDSVYHPDDSTEDPNFPARPNELQFAEESLRNAKAAFDGDRSHYPSFWLYEWQGAGFELVREPVA